MPWGMAQGMCILQWKKCTCGYAQCSQKHKSAERTPALEFSEAVALPDAWCIGWDILSAIRIWTHLKTNSLVFEDDFT